MTDLSSLTGPFSADDLIALRRDLHRYPEPSWCEFHTTSRVVDAIEAIGVDELHLGRSIHTEGERMALPEDDELQRWHDQAADRGARTDVLEQTAGGFTGAIATLHRGEGPVVALRIDIDGIRQTESTDPDHEPTEAGFRSENDGVMHACGHDGHMTIGLGVLQAVAASDFRGTFKLIAQPAEEVAGGAASMAESGHLDDVDSLLCVHLGLGRPTGTVVAGIVEPYAVTNYEVQFTGESAHAGKEPQAGRNCMQAAATAIQNLYGIARHADGVSRVNVGRVESGTAQNVIADGAVLSAEVRGETNAIREFMDGRFRRVVQAAGEMHDCESSVEVVSDVPRQDSDPALSEHVAGVAREHPDVDTVNLHAPFGAGEDATHLMQRVEEMGGSAVYSIVGTDHPGGHHSPTFDLDERSLTTAIDVLSGAILGLGDAPAE